MQKICRRGQTLHECLSRRSNVFKRVSLMKQRLQRHVSVVVERAGNRGHVVVDRLVPERLIGALSTECQHPVYVDDAR